MENNTLRKHIKIKLLPMKYNFLHIVFCVIVKYRVVNERNRKGNEVRVLIMYDEMISRFLMITVKLVQFYNNCEKI